MLNHHPWHVIYSYFTKSRFVLVSAYDYWDMCMCVRQDWFPVLLSHLYVCWSGQASALMKVINSSVYLIPSRTGEFSVLYLSADNVYIFCIIIGGRV